MADNDADHSCLVDKLSNIGELNASDIDLLLSLEKDRQSYKAGDIVRQQGRESRDLYVVAEGWAYSAADLEDGNRQIVNIFLPGDIVGMGDLPFQSSISSVVSLTDTVLCPFPRRRIRDILEESRRLATILFIVEMRQHALLIDRVIAIGQRQAFERICHLLLELSQRAQECSKYARMSLHIPLTQQQIGAMLGLTSIHVNRTFRRLREQNLVNISRARIEIPDLHRLSEAAGVETAFSEINLEWLKEAVD